MIGTKRRVACPLALLVLGACTNVHNPDLRELRVPAKAMKDFTPHRAVTLTNGAPDLGRLAQSYYGWRATLLR